jgi:hypothetical protein
MNAEVITPFSFKTPENLKPSEIAQQFVDHEAYQKLIPSGHTFIQGPRGSGKSMLFRYMAPATQCVVKSCNISGLPFFAINLSVKNCNVQIQELKRLSETQARLIAENLLVIMVAIQICRSFEEVYEHGSKDDTTLESWINILGKYIDSNLSEAGYTIDHFEINATISEKLKRTAKSLELVERWTQDYLNHLTFINNSDIPPYQRKLLSYQFFLYPIFKALKEVNTNTNQTFYVLVDDADWLREEQTKVLNTWISFRTSDVVSFKAACQFDYPTFLTSGTRRIESPHDFSRVNLNTIYTHGDYQDWVKNVVNKRLNAFDIQISAENFFPEDDNQKQQLIKIQAEIESSSWKGPVSSRREDDSYRYARPELIKRLNGQTYRYLYCGFNPLVDLSNATIRFFLEAASEMYAKQQHRNAGKTVAYISPRIQDEVLRHRAESLMLANFDEIVRDFAGDSKNAHLVQRVNQVKNLVDSIGAAFFASLIHPTRSERRVLAFALQNEVDKELQEVLKLAVSLNFFSESSLGKKEGLGRTRRYVLNRCIAPYFNLDPSGFSGYFWITSELLKVAIENPARFKDTLRQRLPSISEGSQMSLPIEDLSDKSEFLDIHGQVQYLL